MILQRITFIVLEDMVRGRIVQWKIVCYRQRIYMKNYLNV